ncbi:restriction endonuclease subunit S [Nocardia takedensis]
MNAWPKVAFADAFTVESAGRGGLPRSRYLPAGVLPVVDQGRADIAGYTDDHAHGYRGDLPVILFGDHTRQVKYVDFPFAVGAEGVKVLRPRPAFYPRYLFHAVRALPLPHAGYARHFRFLERAEIPAPPPDTQRAIAAALDRVDGLRADRRRSLTLTDDLARSLFADTVGNPDAWPHARLDQVADLFSGGTLPAGIPFTGQDGGYLLLKVADLNAPGNETALGSARLWSPAPGTSATTCPAGCLVLPKRGGAIATDKKRITARPAVLDPNLMGVRPHGVDLRYLHAWFRELDLSRLATGSSVPQLNKKDLAPLSIPLPPPDRQRRFARQMTALDRAAAEARAHLAELDALAESVRERAFEHGWASPRA